jgi:hypothetical protein
MAAAPPLDADDAAPLVDVDTSARPVATRVRPCGYVAECRSHFLDAENASRWG